MCGELGGGVHVKSVRRLGWGYVPERPVLDLKTFGLPVHLGQVDVTRCAYFGRRVHDKMCALHIHMMCPSIWGRVHAFLSLCKCRCSVSIRKGGDL